MSFPKTPAPQVAPPPPPVGMSAPEILSLTPVDEDAEIAKRRARGLGRLRVPLNQNGVAARLALSGEPGVQA